MSSIALPDTAQVVVVGGGIIGCSVAYHLVKLGYTDVVVLLPVCARQRVMSKLKLW